jgi:hypothetical protein
MAFEIVEFEKLIESQYYAKYPRACRRISNSGQGTKLSKYHFQIIKPVTATLWHYAKTGYVKKRRRTAVH